MPPLPPPAAKKVTTHVGAKANARLVTAGKKENGRPIEARLPCMNPRDTPEPCVSFIKKNTTSATGPPKEGMKCIPEVELGAKLSAAIETESEERRAVLKGQTAKLDCLECGRNRHFITNSKKKSPFDATKIAFLSCSCILAGWQLLCTAPVDQRPVQDAHLSSTTNVKVASVNNSINSRWKERDDDCCYYTNTLTMPHCSSRTGTTSRSNVCEEHGVDYDPCGGYARKKVSAAAAGISIQQLLKQKNSLLSFPSALLAEAKPTVASGLAQRRLEDFIEKQAEEETKDDDSQDDEGAQLEQQQQQSPREASMEESREEQGREESRSHYQSEGEQQTQHSCYRVDPSSSIPFYIDLRGFARSRCRQGEQVSTFAGSFDLHSSVAAGSASSTAAPASRDPFDEVQDAEKEDNVEEEAALNKPESIRKASKEFKGESPMRPSNSGNLLDTAAASSAAPPHLDESEKGTAAFARKWKNAVHLGLSSASSAAASAASLLYSAADAVKTGFASRSVADTMPPTEPSSDSTKASSTSAAAPETANLATAGEDVVLQFLSVDWAALSELYRGPAFHASHTMPSAAAAAAEDGTKKRYALTDGISSAPRTGSHVDPAAPARTSHMTSAADQLAQRTDEKSSSSTAADGEAAHLMHHRSAAQRLLHNAEDKSISTDLLEELQTLVLPPGDSAATASDSSITGSPAEISVHTAATVEGVPRRRPFSSAAGAFAAAARAAEARIDAEAVATHQSHTPVRERSSSRQLHRGIEDEENQDMLLVKEQSAKRGAVALLRCVVKQQKTHKQQHTSMQSPHVPTHPCEHTESPANLLSLDEEVASHDEQQNQQQGDDMQQRLVLRSHGIVDLEPVVLVPAPAQLQRQLAFKLQLHRQQRDAHQKTQKEEEQHGKQANIMPHIQQHPKANGSIGTKGPSHDPLPALLQVVVPVEQSRVVAAWLRRVLLGPGVVARRWEAAALSAATASNSAHSLDFDAASAGGVFTDASAFPASAAAGADQTGSGESAGGERQQREMKRHPGAGPRQARRFLLKQRDQQQQQQEDDDASLLHQQFSPHRQRPLPSRDKHARDNEEAAKEREERRQTLLQLPVWLIEIPLRDVVEAWLPQPGHRQNSERYHVNSTLQMARAAAANGPAEEQEGEPEIDLAAKVNQVIEAFSLHAAGDVMEDDVAAPARELEAVTSEASTEESIPLEAAARMHRRGAESAWTSLRLGIEGRREEEQMLEGQPLLRLRQLLYAEVDRTLPFVLQELQHYILFRHQGRTATAVRASIKNEVEEKDEEVLQPLWEDAEYVRQREEPSAFPAPRDYQRHRQYRNEQQQDRRAENYSYTKISAFPHPTWAPHRNSHHTQSNMHNSQRSGSSIGERPNKGFMMAQVYVAGIQLRCALLHSIGEVCPSSYNSSVPEAIAEAVRRSLLKDVAHLGVSNFNCLAAPPPANSDSTIRPGAALKRYAGGSEIRRNNEQAAWAAAEAATDNESERPATAAGEYPVDDEMPQSSARNVWLPLPREVVLVQHKHANEYSDTIFYSLTCRCVFTPALGTKASTAGIVVEEEIGNHQLDTILGELDATEETCPTTNYHVPLIPVSGDHLSLLPRMHYC